MRLRLALLLLLLAGLAVAVSAQGRPLSHVRGDITKTRSQLAAKQGRAQVLTTDVAARSRRIAGLQSSITSIEQRRVRLQADLDAKQAVLDRTRGELRVARARLARLRLRFAEARRVLAKRLVAMYESGQPSVLSVVLSSHGFSDLLETGHFLSQIGTQDKRLIDTVRRAKAMMTTTVGRLGTLEERQRQAAATILSRRNELVRVREDLVTRRRQFEQARAAKAALLAGVRLQAGRLKGRLDDLEGEQAAIERRIQAATQPAPAASGGGAPAGPIRGGGTFIWPINGVITSPFCERRSYEACHPGMDIAAPTGTPIRAAASGRVILAGYTGGYGNYTCIQHAGALSSCYGHQSRIDVSVGQSVTQGQVIGAVGSTGHSTGPHLHFEARVNGAVVNPLNYLG